MVTGMSIEKKVEFLEINIEKQIEAFRGRRTKNKQSAIRVQVSSTILSATTTVLLGLTDVGNPTLLKNLALCASALVTLLGTWDVFFNYRNLWIRFNSTVTELLSLQTDLAYLLCKGIENVKEEDLDFLYQRYQLILEATNKNWSELRQQQQSSQPKI